MPSVEALRDEIESTNLNYDVQFVFVADTSEETLIESYGEPTVAQLGVTDIPLLVGPGELCWDWDLLGTVRERSHVWDPCNESMWHYEHLYWRFWNDDPKAARRELRNAILLIASDGELGEEPPVVNEVFDANPALTGFEIYDGAVGDVNGNGFLDVVNPTSEGIRIWINDGEAQFEDSGQLLPKPSNSAFVSGVFLGDLDGDSDLDIFVTHQWGSNNENQVWLNNGGVFEDSGQTFGNTDSGSIALGDLDSDGDLDAFVLEDTGNLVWLNDGNAGFTDSGQSIGGSPDDDSSYSYTNVSLADVDGDGDLDAFVVQWRKEVALYFNDGNAHFSDSFQSFGTNYMNVALGDLDSDGDVDIFGARYEFGNLVWLNDGSGEFSNSGQELGYLPSNDVNLGDLDGDGDLDAFVGNDGPDMVWLNQGDGQFIYGQPLGGDNFLRGSDLGDFDGDGDLDVLVAYWIWTNLTM